MLEEYMIVKTLVEKDGIPAGTIGIVVSLYENGPACEVEFGDSDSNPIDVVTYTFDEIEVVL